MSLSNKVLCINLRTSCLGTSFVDSTLTAHLEHVTGADKKKVKGSKKILGDALKEIQSELRGVKTFAKENSLPGISDDLRIITPKLLDKVRAEVLATEERIQALVAKFSEVVSFTPATVTDQVDERGQRIVTLHEPMTMTLWQSLQEQDKIDLKGAFDPHDYPPLENLPQFFSVRLTTCDLPQGDFFRVEGLTDEAVEKLKADHAKMVESISSAARNDVHRKLVEMVNRVAESLAKEDISKLHNTTFTNLLDYLDQVPDLNITNDPHLDAMVREVREKLNFTMAQVKASAVLKEQAAAAAKDILNRFGKSERKVIVDLSPEPAAAESAA
jgi:hypothetical protein